MFWKIVLRERFGGQGSGNYGHAGRPGEVGGSGEGGASQPSVTLKKGTVLFHATPTSNIDLIKKEGLKTSTEVSGANTYPNDVEGVFLGNLEQAKVIKRQLEENSGEPVSILEVYLPKGAKLYRDSSMPESSVVSPVMISARNIRVIGKDVEESTLASAEHKNTDFTKWFE